jgi:hypothetical protein
MQLVSSGQAAELGRYIGYYQPYATSHEALDRDGALLDEVRNAARAVAERVRQLSSGHAPPGAGLEDPRPK